MTNTNQIDYENLPFKPASYKYDSVSDLKFHAMQVLQNCYI